MIIKKQNKLLRPIIFLFASPTENYVMVAALFLSPNAVVASNTTQYNIIFESPFAITPKIIMKT